MTMHTQKIVVIIAVIACVSISAASYPRPYEPVPTLGARLSVLGYRLPESLKSSQAEKMCEATRPKKYNGNRFVDLGELYVWRSGEDGAECATGCWYEVRRKEGDRVTSKGKCTGGALWHEISLVQ